MKEPSTSKNKKDNLLLLELSNYTSPEISENPSKKWIKYGDDNDYFGYLLDRYKGSSTNHALINGISQMIVGEGLESKDETTQEENWEQVNSLFTYQDLSRWAFDYKGLGFYMQQIILSKDGSKIARVKHTPVQNWRSGKADSNGVVNEYFYSDDWSKYTQPKYRPVCYPAYSPEKKDPLQIMAVKPYRAGSFYYPNVDYQGALQYAHIEEEISNFHINNLLNGMFPSLLINFNNGEPDSDTRREIESSINNKWGGTTSTGKIIIAFNDDKDRAASVDPVSQPDLDKMFDLLSKESSEKIMIGHRVTSPALFGVRSGSGLGNNADELRVAAILFEETVIRPYRLMMLENINQLLLHNGVKIDLSFKSLNPFKKFPSYQEEKPLETPNKMDIADGTELSKEDDRPYMTDDQQDAILDAIDPYGEPVDGKDWFEVDVADVHDEEEEDKLFEGNESDR